MVTQGIWDAQSRFKSDTFSQFHSPHYSSWLCCVCDFCFVGVNYGIPQIMMKGRVSNVQVVSKYMDKCCKNDFVKE